MHSDTVANFSRAYRAIFAAGLFACSGAAYAQAALSYDFGILLTSSSPNYVPPNDFSANPFAHLEVSVREEGKVWRFTLTINNNLFSSFGDNAFIGSMSFDFTPDPPKTPKSTFVASNRGGVTAVYSTSGTGNSGLPDIDFGTQFGKGSRNRLSQNDYVTWDVSGLRGSQYTNMYVHVQGIEDGYSAKYTPLVWTPPPPPQPVPEPETYAMLLAGLGLIGFRARRKKHCA
jgi:hypothetical protein